ncbi:F-box protein [Actinidia chinensis var. chinensis]|uniref:F-box protein n=1 Tax=Actinidia chinensis var. chinensis TaxID=1590841 RepID=A0A2R6PM99_ACTCC|nr:F-box protein [Actinidia chinensis var. chinensis]
MVSSSSYRDWAWLPKNLLWSIVETYLDQFSDFMRYSSVCQQWRCVALENNHRHKQTLNIFKACHNKLPMLLMGAKENHDEKRLLFSVTEGITYEVQLPSPCHNRFFGSSFGWLFTVDKTIITLLNPFTGRAIPLPAFKDPFGYFEDYMDEIRDYFVEKGIILSDPCLSPNSYEVVVIYGGMCRLAFFRSGDNSWNFINTKRDYVFSDVVYHKGQVYAVNCWSELVKIDVASEVDHVVTKRSRVCAQVAYLVESQEGDLLLVQRFWKSIDVDDENNSHSKTFKFKVFKLVYPVGEAQEKWIEIKNIGGQALFLGDNHSLAVSTSEFSGCQSNCIYYTDQNHVISPPYVCHGLDDDLGVFNLEDGKFQPHYIPDLSEKQMFPPIWFVPNLKGN